MSPSAVIVFLNDRGSFTCDTIGGDFTTWRVNGTSVQNRDVKDVDHFIFNGSFTLTIRARAVYNGTTVQCVTGYFDSVSVKSEIVTLTIQGS